LIPSVAGRRPAGNLAKKSPVIANPVLNNQPRRDSAGIALSGFLDTLREIADYRLKLVKDLLDAYGNRYGCVVDPVYKRLRY